MFPLIMPIPMFMPNLTRQSPEDWEIVIDGTKYKLVKLVEEIMEEKPIISTNERVIKLRAELAELRNKLNV